MFDVTSLDSRRRERSLTTLVWASAMGTYLLVAIGGVTTLLDGGSSCTEWPTCGAGGLGTLSDPGVVVALGHRVVALLVALVLVATLVFAWRQRRGRVTASLTLAALLYPFQVGVGALTVTRDMAVLSAVHLTLGVGIFAFTMLALLWHLERTNQDSPAESTGEAASHETPPTPEDAAVDPQPHTNPTGRLSMARDRVLAYLHLTKPRLMWLLCLVAVAAMALAAGPDLSMYTTLATLTGGVLAVGASGVFNNVLERDVDQQMERTADRPLVQERIPVQRAVAFGLALAVLSVGVFVFFVNLLAGALGLLAILFYSVLYTLVLKPTTRQNIVLGGAVGAFPALIGWAAIENEVGLPAVVLGAVIFLWTPAHFYNLALAYRSDYAEAGFPMLPVVSGRATTRRHILLYLGATLIGSVVLGVTTRLDWLYAITIVLVGAVFLWTVVRQFREQTEQAALRTFHASNAYLGCLLVAVSVDALVV